MAPKPIAIVSADCHVDHLIWRSRPEIRGDAYYAFDQVVNLAVTRKLPLILAGDVVETLPADAPSSETVRNLRLAMLRARKAGVHVYSTRGQHDQSTTDWLYACGGPPPPTVQEQVEIGGRTFGFLPWMPEALLAEVLPTIQTEVVVCHQVWSELMGGRSVEGKLANFKNAELVISGDYHRRVSKTVDRENGKTLRVLSPGATHMRKINEPTTHSAAVLHDDLSVKWVNLRSRRVLRVTLDSEESIETLLRTASKTIADITEEAIDKGLPSDLVTPLLIVTDTSNLVGVEPRIQQTVGLHAHVFYRGGKSSKDDPDSIDYGDGGSSYSLSEYIQAETVGDPEVGDLLQSLFVDGASLPATIAEHEQRHRDRVAAT